MSDDQMFDQVQNGTQNRQYYLAVSRIDSGSIQNILRLIDLRTNAALLKTAKNEKRGLGISVDLVFIRTKLLDLRNKPSIFLNAFETVAPGMIQI